MPRMTMTTTSSMSVKPFCSARFISKLPVLCVPLGTERRRERRAVDRGAVRRREDRCGARAGEGTRAGRAALHGHLGIDARIGRRRLRRAIKHDRRALQRAASGLADRRPGGTRKIGELRDRDRGKDAEDDDHHHQFDQREAFLQRAKHVSLTPAVRRLPIWRSVLCKRRFVKKSNDVRSIVQEKREKVTQAASSPNAAQERSIPRYTGDLPER